MTKWDIFLVLVSDAICIRFGMGIGWSQGFDAAEKIWEPCVKQMQLAIRALYDRLRVLELP